MNTLLMLTHGEVHLWPLERQFLILFLLTLSDLYDLLLCSLLQWTSVDRKD